MRKASEKQADGEEEQQDDVPRDTQLKYQYIESPVSDNHFNQINQVSPVNQINQQYEIIQGAEQYNNQAGINYAIQQGAQTFQPTYMNIENQAQEYQEYEEGRENQEYEEGQEYVEFQVDQENEDDNLEEGEVEENVEYEEIEENVEIPDNNIEGAEGEEQEDDENIQKEGQIVQENIEYQTSERERGNKVAKQVVHQENSSYKINKDGNKYEVDEETKKYKINSPNSPNDEYQIKKQTKITTKIESSPNNPQNIQGENPKTNSQSNSINRKSIKTLPKDNLPKVYIQSSGLYSNYSQKKNTKYYGEIPRYMSFQKSTVNKPTKIRSSINVVKTENISELIEIPREEYPEYAGRETIFIGGGMETGEYKFRGQGIAISQTQVPQKIIISEEEILKEINRRKNKLKKEKQKRYEIIDKFYARTVFDGKPIKKIEKLENQKQQYEYEEQQNYYSSSKGNMDYEINSKESQSQNINYNINNQSQQSKNSHQIQFNITNQSQVSQPFSKSKMKSQIESNSKFQQIQYKLNQSGNNSMNINNKKLIYNVDYTTTPSDNFSKYLFEQINNLRQNPKSYIKVIENAKKNIIKDKYGRLIYNGKIKIALSSGEEAFNNAINYLNSINPMEQLLFNKYLLVELPKSENEIKYKNYLRLKVENMLNNGINIKSYWRDIIKDPEISFLMMIVDDNGDFSGMRRKDLLDPKMKYIGINSIDINGNFVCYITLCTSD